MAALADRPLLLDAGMGTRLIAAAVDVRGYEAALRPDLVVDIHARDVAAGSDALLTSTFGANAGWLGRSRHAEEIAAINRRAVNLAREAAGPDRFLLGSIGPTAGDSARKQAAILAAEDVDGLILETHRSDGALAGLARIRRDVGLPILVSLFAFDEPVADAARRLVDAGADVVGVNCVRPDRALGWIAELSEAIPSTPLLWKPAASHPEGPSVAPSDLAADVPALLRHGVRLLGGCCGATEAHVAALRSALDREAAGGL
jgi:methionine synthase I (cobalamin-dependent)